MWSTVWDERKKAHNPSRWAESNVIKDVEKQLHGCDCEGLRKDSVTKLVIWLAVISILIIGTRTWIDTTWIIRMIMRVSAPRCWLCALGWFHPPTKHSSNFSHLSLDLEELCFVSQFQLEHEPCLNQGNLKFAARSDKVADLQGLGCIFCHYQVFHHIQKWTFKTHAESILPPLWKLVVYV